MYKKNWFIGGLHKPKSIFLLLNLKFTIPKFSKKGEKKFQGSDQLKSYTSFSLDFGTCLSVTMDKHLNKKKQKN